MTRKYQRYSKEFKLEAIRLAQTGDKPITEVARDRYGRILGKVLVNGGLARC